jgi:enoyl-CoA hydratase/carnithine racemase
MRWVEAEEALRIGLVDRVTDDPDAAAVARAAELARLDPVAAARVKAVVARSAREQDALAAEATGNRAWDGSVARLEAAHA